MTEDKETWMKLVKIVGEGYTEEVAFKIEEKDSVI